MIRFALFLTLAAGCAGPRSSADKPAAGAPVIQIRNARVHDGYLLGGQPTADQLREAALAGFTTIINLRLDDEEGVQGERELVTQLGLHYVSIPVIDPDGVNEENARKLDAALANAKGPVLIHCRSGSRVGDLIALRAHYLSVDDRRQLRAAQVR
jgi:uncharacterized protein (TIGR01244 family)